MLPGSAIFVWPFPKWLWRMNQSCLSFQKQPLGVNRGLGCCGFRAEFDLVGSLRILCVLSRKITNVRDAEHFLQEVLRGAQEFAYEAEEREAPANDIQTPTAVAPRQAQALRF